MSYEQEALEVPLLFPRKDGPPVVHRISKQNHDLLEAYITLGTVEAAAESAHMNPAQASEFLQSDFVKEYLTKKLEQVAGRVDLTQAKVLAKINEIIDKGPVQKIDPSYLRALDLAARILKLISPTNIMISQSMENPFAKLKDDELDVAIRERLEFHSKGESHG